MSRELAMTGNSWLPEHGEMPSLTGVPSARVLAGLATNMIFYIFFFKKKEIPNLPGGQNNNLSSERTFFSFVPPSISLI